MFKTVEDAVEALSGHGWTEIDNDRAGTFAARGGTLMVLTRDQDNETRRTTYSATAVVCRPATEEQAAAWEKEHGPIREGSALSLLFGAVTGRLVPFDAVVSSGRGPRVWWSPVPLPEWEKDDPTVDGLDTGGEGRGAEAPSPADMPKRRGQVGGVADGDQAKAAIRDVAGELHTLLEVFMGAGFSRFEAFGLVREFWRDYLATSDENEAGA